MDTPQEVLDVWRVEQRLAYLGFPAFNEPADFYGSTNGAILTLPGYFEQPDSNPRKPLDFVVDGRFAAEEESALRAFQSIKSHSAGNSGGGILWVENDAVKGHVSVSANGGANLRDPLIVVDRGIRRFER